MLRLKLIFSVFALSGLMIFAKEVVFAETASIPVQSFSPIPKPICVSKDGSTQECEKQGIPAKKIAAPQSALIMNPCTEMAQWENKILYYEKLSGLSDEELKKENSFSRTDLERILTELKSGLAKLKEQCEISKPADYKKISIEEETLKSGKEVVKMTPSEVAEKLKIVPEAKQLNEQNTKAFYKFTVSEPRRLFGIFPVTIFKTITADSVAGVVIKEVVPWYSFLMTK